MFLQTAPRLVAVDASPAFVTHSVHRAFVSTGFAWNVSFFAIHSFVLCRFEIVEEKFSWNGLGVSGRFPLVTQMPTHLILETVCAFPFSAHVFFRFSLRLVYDFSADFTLVQTIAHGLFDVSTSHVFLGAVSLKTCRTSTRSVT